MAEDIGVHSVESTQKYLLCLANLTTREVDIIWMSFDGREQKYITLKTRQLFKINSYLTHPWIFRDSRTKRRLCFATERNARLEDMRHNLVFVANAVPERGGHVVYICDTFDTLKEKCFELMFKTIDENKVNSLDIPKSLINDYHNYVQLFYRQFL